MRDAYYPNLDAYNADIQAARDAYNADRAVADGRCAACGTRRLNITNERVRKCQKCYRARRKAA